MIQLPRVFERLRDAEQARQELEAAGFPRERTQLTARHDEAGPVEGNFVVGNTKQDTVEHTEFSRTLGGQGDNTYQHNFERTVDGGLYLLVVDVEDETQAERAAAIMQRCGATDVDALVAGRKRS